MDFLYFRCKHIYTRGVDNLIDAQQYCPPLLVGFQVQASATLQYAYYASCALSSAGEISCSELSPTPLNMLGSSIAAVYTYGVQPFGFTLLQPFEAYPWQACIPGIES